MNLQDQPMRTRRFRARDLGWLNHTHLLPGSKNALTDVPGVKVGHATIVQGEPGPLVVGEGPIRTGVTAIIPQPGDLYREKITAAVFVQNGFGKSIGLTQIQETGALETPILLTSSLSVWQVANGLVDWTTQNYRSFRLASGASINPVVGECNDGFLNDIRGRHVDTHHVFEALNAASSIELSEGNVGGGTGLQAFNFKAGIGTSSRIIPPIQGGSYTIGALVQSNFGKRSQLQIQGRPIGKDLNNWPDHDLNPAADSPEQGSCMIILGTDAPLTHRQLTRLARRAPLGLARTGGVSGHGSGEIIVAFSTSNRKLNHAKNPLAQVDRIQAEGVLFDHFAQAVVESVEESILNSLVAAQTMVGRDYHTCHRLPIDLI